MQFFKLFVFVVLFAAALVSAAPVIEKRCNSQDALADNSPTTSVNGQLCNYGDVNPDEM
ncbi:5948_t:CDS:1, partial [Gigaspora rosea]